MALWILGAGAALAAAAEKAVSEAPVPGSPGSTDVATTAARCAAFSWGRVERAVAYELAVYRVGTEAGLDEVEPDPEKLWTRRVAGSLLSFTPPVEDCPARGERHAWTVRAITADGGSEWSAPHFFVVEDGLTDEELGLALEILRRRAQGTVSGERAVSIASSARAGSAEDPRGGSAPVPPGSRATTPDRGGLVRVRSAGAAAGSSYSHLRVAGEVRTVDPDAGDGSTLVWGKGRVDDEVWGIQILGFDVPCGTGEVNYGLSKIEVDWGSAADACPAGTWVCRRTEILPCDTRRPSSDPEGLSCSGAPIEHADDSHRGWVANTEAKVGTTPQYGELGGLFSENGGINTGDTCSTLPVWCCWE
jgi:hypothetical protein